MTGYWTRIVVQIAVLLNVFSCAPESRTTSESDTQGTGLIFFPRPKMLDASELADFSSKIRLNSVTSLPASASASSPAGVVQNTGKAYLEAALQVGGIRREQGEEVLKKIVGDPGESCGGASCSKVLGIHIEQIDTFMDNLFFYAGSMPNTAQRPVLVSSLTRESAFTKSVLPKDIIATVFQAKSISIPSSTPFPTGILTKDEFTSRGGQEIVGVIEQYTNAGFHFARRAETMTQEEAAKQGVAPITYSLWRRRLKLLNEKLPHLPTVNATVYRGLSEVPYETVANWIKKWRAGEPMALGPNDKPAITSATWDIKIAKSFLYLDLASLVTRKEHLSVLLEIHHHRGVGIQNVSLFYKEHEVLLPASQKFQIEEISPIGYFKRAIRIKLKGLDSSVGGTRG